jgi:hypothetical protein
MKKIIFGAIFGILLISILAFSVIAVDEDAINVQVGDEETAVYDDSLISGDAVKTQFDDEAEIKSKMDRLNALLKANQNRLRIASRMVQINTIGDEKEIVDGNASVRTRLRLTAETQAGAAYLKAVLSNGRLADIKIMPATASEVALERLRAKCIERNCSIELKEVGSGDDAKPVYDIEGEKEYKILGLFKAKAKLRARIHAETGDVISADKGPWWVFLAKEATDETSA